MESNVRRCWLGAAAGHRRSCPIVRPSPNRTRSRVRLVISSWQGHRAIESLQPPAPADQSGERTVQAAYAFYGALDHYLRTGDDQVSRLLAPGFRECDVNGQSGSSSDRLATLDGMRGSAFQPTFSIQHVHVAGVEYDSP